MRKVLDKLIAPEQTGVLSGRNISDNLRLTFDALPHLPPLLCLISGVSFFVFLIFVTYFIARYVSFAVQNTVYYNMTVVDEHQGRADQTAGNTAVAHKMVPSCVRPGPAVVLWPGRGGAVIPAPGAVRLAPAAVVWS